MSKRWLGALVSDRAGDGRGRQAGLLLSSPTTVISEDVSSSVSNPLSSILVKTSTTCVSWGMSTLHSNEPLDAGLDPSLNVASLGTTPRTETFFDDIRGFDGFQEMVSGWHWVIADCMVNIGMAGGVAMVCEDKHVEFVDEPTANGADTPSNPLSSLTTAKAWVPADKGYSGRASNSPSCEVAFQVFSVFGILRKRLF